MKKSKEIAIIGMACRFPGAGDYNAFWDNLINGVNSIREIPPERWDISTHYSPDFDEPNKSISKWCGLLDGIDQFDHRFFSISPREAKSMDPQQRLLLEETWRCIEDAGISLKILQEKKTSIYVGVMAGDYHLKRSGMITDSYTALGEYESILANRISYTFGFHGASLIINAACAASLAALHHGRTILLSGESDYAIVAGVNLNIHPRKYISFSKSRMLSPDGQCKTFDKDANGYVPGDGVGVLLLQPLEDALRDKCHIYGVLKGTAVNHTGHTASITAPSVDAQREVILDAYKKAGVSPETVTYVEAHGTGTSLGDPIEVEGLTRSFREYTDKNHFCKIGSVKTNIGHLEGAAGIAGVIKVLLMIGHKKIPPTLNVKILNPVINFENSPFVVATDTGEWNSENKKNPLRAGISSFGFGGVNSHAVIEELRVEDKKFEEGEVGHLFVLSAKSVSGFKNTLERWREFVNSVTYKHCTLKDVCATALTGRESWAFGFGSVVTTKDELKEILLKEITPVLRQSENLWLLITAEVIWEGFKHVEGMVNEHPLYKEKLDRVVREMWDTGIEEEVKKGFYRSTWPETVRPLYSFLVNHALLLTLTEQGFEPDIITGEGDGIWQALTLSGMVKTEDVLCVLANIKSLGEVTISNPDISFYDPVSREILMTCLIDAHYLSTLINDAALSEEEIQFFIEKSRMMHANQHTFKKYLEEWNSKLKERSHMDLQELLYDDRLLFNRDDFNRKERLLLVIILAASHHYVEQKWNLSKVKEISDKIFNELLDLVLDGVMTQEALIDLFTQKEPDLYVIASVLNERLVHLNKEKPYTLLKRHSRVIPTLSERDDWFHKVMDASIPELDGYNCLRVGGVSKEDSDRVVYLTAKEVKKKNDSILKNLLLNLWLKGVDIKWDLFYRNGSFNKIALPVYGFDRLSFWLNKEEESLTVNEKTEGSNNPQFPCRLRQFDNHGFKYKQVQTKDDSIIASHIIGGKAILPGASMIESAIEAIERATNSPVKTLENIVFKNPCVAEKELTLEITVNPERKTFTIKTESSELCIGEYS